MIFYLGLLIFSFVVNSILIIPFIDFLYKVKFTRRCQRTKDFLGKKTPIFDKLHACKAGTPVGGGILMIIATSFLYLLFFFHVIYSERNIVTAFPMKDELNILFFTFISFGLLGLYDDIMKFFEVEKTRFFGLRMRHKMLLELILGLVIGAMLFLNLKIDFIYLPFWGSFYLGPLYVIFAALLIVFFANAFNITDGLDGLSAGALMIFLFSFWIISAASLDTILSIFISLWIGSLIAFLYFNIYPARIWLGDVGALSFGATMAVVGLLLGKIVPLFIVGGIFVVEALSSLFQILSKVIRKKKLFPVAPIHLWLQLRKWEEPKIVMRAWLAGIMLAVFGLWLAQL